MMRPGDLDPDAFDALLAKSGVSLSAADIATIRALVRAMEEAASVVDASLLPAEAPATMLRLSRSSPSSS